MLQIQPAIALEDIFGWSKAETRCRPINPFATALQFEEVANRRLIQSDNAWFPGRLVDAPVFFIAERGGIAEFVKHAVENVAGADRGLEFRPAFVRARFRRALKSEDEPAAALAQTQQHTGRQQTAVA